MDRSASGEAQTHKEILFSTDRVFLETYYPHPDLSDECSQLQIV